MSPREVMLSRRLAIDYLLIGMAIAAPKAIKGKIEPKDMITERGTRALNAVFAGDRESFQATVFHKQGFRYEDDESISKGIIRIIKETNVERHTLDLADVILETVARSANLNDVNVGLEHAHEIVKDAIASLGKSNE